MRIALIGNLDELNSRIGLLLSEVLPADVRSELLAIQNDLFDLGGALALPNAPFSQDKVQRLDAAAERYNANLPPLKEFILPGGTRAAALCHVARTQARAAERSFVSLMKHGAVPQHGLPYLNRLSDLLFILSRVINQTSNQPETLWDRTRLQGKETGNN